VQTVDFFTPIVDDPYAYGQIAAANSLSDVYAMGGRPLTALAIAGFPEDALDRDTVGAIFRGGYDKLAQAGVALLGGHTVRDPELKFGYAVTGAVNAARIWANASARAGDRLILTKPIGTGVIGTAIKNARAPQTLVRQAIASMATLNKAAADAVRDLPGVHSCTDITGFGLIGHASEVAEASGITIRIDAAAVPLFAGVRELLERNRNGGMLGNRLYFGDAVRAAARVAPDLMELFYDPQTSGGLLFFVDAAAAPALLEALSAADVPAASIGRTVERTGARIEVQ
jgi:selenide,water dikinase